MAKSGGTKKKAYWEEYSNLQRVKHDLIQDYLGGWFPKITKWNGRVVYIDTHAGRGTHLKGELGSPLVALDTLLNHRALEMVTSGGEVVFTFIEHNAENLAALESELKAKEPLPKGVKVYPHEGDSFELIDSWVSELEAENKSLAPSFVFCDPFGFSVPGELLHRLMKFNRVELFVNIIWRELDMAMAQGRNGTIKDGMRQTLDLIFNGHDWLNEIDGETSDERADQCANLFREIVGARWGTFIRMVDNGRTRYFLLHLTNHEAGRDLMKNCIWSACPDGGYYARKSDDPKQQHLIMPEPDMGPIEDWVRFQLVQGPRRWKELHELVREEVWLEKHVNEIVRGLRKDGSIVAEDYEGRFSASANPRLRLV
ncbi:three-Cys-motif partner protein TcmP [Blastopirellula sp. J2-11]|uniref:three-Cys-motif partner protein TcmP n=1 Tax=Blastopirellula sp. J2-11 TaxID=2943192 RepID=UPI0021C6EF80|nr:three-Cys-motif partner protein TcmP [Blastopirellula sp. J2-11]UUO08094.1 three-Cys-motif partner protein TcmP [Blastopirellula sp. J2-11]